MEEKKPHLTSLNMDFPIWEQVFTVHPLVIVGSLDKDEELNFAPKHMAFPLGWKNYFGFVCTPRHKTYQNIRESGEFTVTFPKPDQVVITSLTASPRCDDGSKPDLAAVKTFPASEIKGVFVENGYIFLECKLLKFVDGFGENSLVLGEVIAAHALNEFIKNPSHSDNEILFNNPQLVYIAPDRYAVVSETQAFPFPDDFKK
jgi:flavin reductase (DIM6/NTAB) family NADH-FMN oxidoreductase RutF